MATAMEGMEALDLLREQARLYARLEGRALRQRELIVSGRSGPLLALMAERDQLTRELQVIAERLRPVREDWASFRGQLTAEQRAEAEALISGSAANARRVMERDAEDSRLLATQKKLVEAARVQTRQAEKALRAYRPEERDNAEPRRLDEAS